MKQQALIRTVTCAAFIGFVFCLSAMAARAQTTSFTYQGRFTDSSTAQPTNGTYTMTFRLFDTETNGNQVPNNAAAVTSMVSVVNGIFTVKLDFTQAAFNTTQPRYLEIQVGATILTPRQEITSTPFSQRALNAANADSLGGVAANQYVQTNDARLSDARVPTTGSADYIQNTTAPQTANFNVGGSGVIGGKVGIGTTVAPTTASLQVVGGILARGGAPGGGGASDNGYAFSGSGGDNDSGMFSTADGTLQFYADNAERIRLTRGVDLKAGNGNNVSGSGIGGAGAGITLLAGSGGDGNPGGTGANIALQAGNGGNGGGTGGTGANITLQAGNGGFGLGVGGAGAGITLRAGNGGNSNFNAGNGASITLQPGTGGTSSNQTPGTTGNVILAPTNGNVGIGTTSPTTKLSVTGDLTVSGIINGTVTNATNADKLDNLDSSQFVQTTDTTTFIRNQTAQQAGNFNISGSGTIGGNLNAAGNVLTNGGLFAVGGSENLRVVRGVFQVNSGNITIVSGSGFSVTRNGVGNYSINFTTPFSNLPAISPSVVSGATIIGTSALGVAGTTITAFSPNGNPGDPSFVMFIAVGPK